MPGSNGHAVGPAPANMHLIPELHPCHLLQMKLATVAKKLKINLSRVCKKTRTRHQIYKIGAWIWRISLNFMFQVKN